MKMIRWAVMLAGLGLWMVAARAAEEGFSKAVSPADFAAAGLSKLTPEERARLDALVRDYKTGALEAARREAAAAAAARVQAEAATARAEATARSEAERAAKAEADARARTAEVAAVKAARKPEKADKPEGGLLQRAKVLLTPGTQIEYSTLEAKIVGEFRGWQPRTVFTLDNGQRWQVMSGESYVVSAEPGPKVKIVPGALGSFFMHVDGHRQRAKVAIVSDGK